MRISIGAALATAPLAAMAGEAGTRTSEKKSVCKNMVALRHIQERPIITNRTNWP